MPPLVTRAGRFVKQPMGYRAFIPAPLPPDPPLTMDAHLFDELGARADDDTPIQMTEAFV